MAETAGPDAPSDLPAAREVETALPLRVVARGEGRPVLLVHGFGASRFTWRHWAPDLARTHRVVEVDLKGFGGAPAPPGDTAYSPLDQADLVRRLVLELELEDAVLVGHSLGGGIVLVATARLEAERPGAVGGVVVVNGACFPQQIPPFISVARIPGLGRLLLDLTPKRALVRAVLRTLVHDPDTLRPGTAEGYAAPLRRPETRRAVLLSARQLLPEGTEAAVERYGGIRAPALLLWGRQDPITPLPFGARLRDVVPGARLEVLEPCGHVVPEERPAEALGILRGFLAGEGGGGP